MDATLEAIHETHSFTNNWDLKLKSVFKMVSQQSMFRMSQQCMFQFHKSSHFSWLMSQMSLWKLMRHDETCIESSPKKILSKASCGTNSSSCSECHNKSLSLLIYLICLILVSRPFMYLARSFFRHNSAFDVCNHFCFYQNFVTLLVFEILIFNDILRNCIY